MTLEEAKKILESEGFEPERFLGVLVEDVKAASWEKIEVSEAMKVVAENGYFPFMEKSKYEERKARLKKEYEKNTKAPGSAENRIKEDSGVNPALKESATQFNDALLDEQAKKIAELTKENERLERVSKTTTDEFNELYYRMITKSDKIEALGKEIAKLNGIIHKKNLKIEELGKESSGHLRGKMKMFGENFDLEQELKDKNAVLSDVAEELRLSKIREKNLTELCQKYVKEVEDLREKLADKVVDKIDAQALKSAESALAWKEKVIAEKDMAIAYNKKEIADLGEKLAATKKELEGANNLVEIVRKGSKEYCEYGIAAEKMIQKMAKDIVNDRPVSPKDYEQYRHWAKGYRFNPQLPERTDEEEKKPNTSKSALDDLKEKAYNSFNAKAHNLGPVGSKDGNGILDQLFGVDIAEEGTDQSATIVQCDKGITLSKEEIEIIEYCTKKGYRFTLQ
ncbi:hypothetical protein F7D95_08120 [Prevotella copri]|uniref:Uncharacterized protein n=1 Tax=Segatella copri TaxID=165179 RepID=A0AA90ZLG0_9BACT|nr:hypothetical protein [Segatella copri]MQN12785.1 hypothetical protein [Segatella copri]